MLRLAWIVAALVAVHARAPLPAHVLQNGGPREIDNATAIIKELADNLVAGLKAKNHGPDVVMYAQGDSTMWAQTMYIVKMLEQEGGGTLQRETFMPGQKVNGMGDEWDHDSIESLHLETLAPEWFPAGTARFRDNGTRCDQPNLMRYKAVMGGFQFTFIGCVCANSVMQIPVVPTVFDALKDPDGPYKWTELESPDLVYLGGAGLHHLHDENTRAFAEVESMVGDDVFEERLSGGLKSVTEYLPAETKLAYFNTHWVCDAHIDQADLAPRIQACAKSEAACWGCADAEPSMSDGEKHCDAVPSEKHDIFKHTLMGTVGSTLLATREKETLAQFPDVTLVDGYGITKEMGCEYAEDGKHYFGAEVKELAKAFELLVS